MCICFWNWILVETKPLEFLLQLPGPSSENVSSSKIESLTFGLSLAAGWIVPSCQVVFQAWFLIKIWMITWRNSFARKPPNLLVSKPPSFNFAWLPNKFLILFGGQRQFLKLVGEQPFLKFWSAANQNFWNWSVSNHFWNFGRWPTIIFENGWWATIFQTLVGGQPNFWKWLVANQFVFLFCLHKFGAVHTYFCQNRGCAHLFSAIFEHVHTYFSQLTGVHTYQIEFGRWPTKIFQLVGEQPFSKFWSVANHNFWNWSVSNHFRNFGRWPTIIFEIGWWATIFQILVGGQPFLLKLVGEQPFFKFWLVANHFFENGRWAAIFENLVRGQP